MKIINEIKKGLIQASVILTILGLAGIAYAAITPITEVTTGDALQATEYNKLVQKLNRIDEKSLATAWVNFDGVDCPSNICVIRDSFNVSQVKTIGTGRFEIYFENNMDNTNYIFSGSAGNFNGTTTTGRDVSLDGTNYVNYFNVRVTHTTNTSLSDRVVMVQVLGGKN